MVEVVHVRVDVEPIQSGDDEALVIVGERDIIDFAERGEGEGLELTSIELEDERLVSIPCTEEQVLSILTELQSSVGVGVLGVSYLDGLEEIEVQPIPLVHIDGILIVREMRARVEIDGQVFGLVGDGYRRNGGVYFESHFQVESGTLIMPIMVDGNGMHLLPDCQPPVTRQHIATSFSQRVRYFKSLLQLI